MNAERQEQLLSELRALDPAPGAASLAYINLRNFKVFNVFAGHTAGDALIERLQSLLGELAARCWRVGGDQFVALIQQPLAAARETMRRWSWLLNVRFAVTEAWRIEFSDGERRLVPFRAFDVACVPRIGLAEISADAGPALTLAIDRADEHRLALSTGDWIGYAALPTGHWMNLVTLAEPLCPRCQAKPEVVDQDLGWSSERCPACAASYERHDRIFVEGREQSGGYA